METRRKFSREFKLEAVKMVKDRGVALKQAARDLDLNENMLRRWVREFSEDPQDAFPGWGQMKPEEAEIARLQREVAKLKMERDILKKAAVSSTGHCNTISINVERSVAWQRWVDRGYLVRKKMSYGDVGKLVKA